MKLKKASLRTVAQFVIYEVKMRSNKLVDFLASYGPLPSANNLYDEFVVEAAKKYGCQPIRIASPLIDKLTNILNSERPVSIILTGTAGDGKTYTARKVAEKLTGDHQFTGFSEKIYQHPMVNKRGGKIKFIKDLSEFNDKEKNGAYPEIRASLSGESLDVYVICVNDGQLLKFFRDQEDWELHGKFSEMLRNDKQEDSALNFELINMSRRSHQEILDDIFDGIVDHGGWDGCRDCHLLQEKKNPCPIRINRKILMDTCDSSMRKKLKDLIRIAADDGHYLSIRQIILLTVNVLLGDEKSGSKLLNCKKARNRAKNNQYCLTNPYRNVFGLNLGDRNRHQYRCFNVMNRFQIGYETNNHFDKLLIWNSNDSNGCEFYGEKIFTAKHRYLNDPNSSSADFQEQLIDQRRRLFFSTRLDMFNIEENIRKNPWNLTIFQHGHDYIAMTTKNPDKNTVQRIRSSLFKGLNRMMTGKMTTTSDRLWITMPAGVFLGHEIPLLVEKSGSMSASSQIKLKSGSSENSTENSPPTLSIEISGYEKEISLKLRPTLVECLFRVSNGALPASFSAECIREIERFQLRVTSIFRKVNNNTIPISEIEMSNGDFQEKPIYALSDRDDWSW